jgi:hypothetical protein
MSHPKDLIARILDLLHGDYPPATHVYTTEKAIAGTRFFPDIVIADAAGTLVCAVEIGYTRPEKLTYYKNVLQIPDVRWYDKQGVLHTVLETKSVLLRAEIVGPAPEEVAVYRINDRLDCPDCFESVLMSDEEYAAYCEDVKADGGTPESQDYFFDKACEEASEDVWAVLITDYVKAFLVAYCDKCNTRWLAERNNEITANGILMDLEDALRNNGLARFGMEYGARRMMSWADACKAARKEAPWLDADLNYVTDGDFLDDPEGQKRAMASIRATVRTALVDPTESPATENAPSKKEDAL